MSNALTRTAAWRFFYVQIWRRSKLAWLLVRAYAFNLLVAIDIVLNAVIGGDPGETISSRAGKGRRKDQPVHTFAANAIDTLFKAFFQEANHCETSIQQDEGKNAISEVIDRYQAGEKQIWRL